MWNNWNSHNCQWENNQYKHFGKLPGISNADGPIPISWSSKSASGQKYTHSSILGKASKMEKPKCPPNKPSYIIIQ